MKVVYRLFLSCIAIFACWKVFVLFITFMVLVLCRQSLKVSFSTNNPKYDSENNKNRPVLVDDKSGSNNIDHIISTGQSLSLGISGSPALSTTQPYGNLQLENFSFEPLIEREVESMSSALANHITFTSNSILPTILISKGGKNGAPYLDLKKGTLQYENSLEQAYLAKEKSAILGKLYRVVGITAIHGESDHLFGTTKEEYRDNLIEWQKDFESDIRLITLQNTSIPLFTDQVSSWSISDSAHSIIPIAQYDASKANPKKIILVGPKYFLQYAPGSSHLINTSYRWLGEYYGKVIKKVIYEGKSFTPLSPKKVVSSGREVYIQLNVPVKPIVIDTKNVLSIRDYGFEYLDKQSLVSISSVQLYDSDMIKIVLKSLPTGTAQRLRYAYTAVPKSDAGAYASGSARGNIRDSDTTESLYGNKLYNWLIHFDEPVENDTGKPTISITQESATGTSISVSDDSSIASLDFFGTDSKKKSACSQSLPFVGTQPIVCNIERGGSGFLTIVATDLFGQTTKAKYLEICEENLILKGLKELIALVNHKKVTSKCTLYSIQ